MRRNWTAILGACSCLFTAAACASTPAQIPLVLQHVKTNRTVSPGLFADLEELSRVVDIAYCVGGFGLGIERPFECPSRCGDFESFELVTTWNTGPLLSDSCGFIALSHAPAAPRIIIAFRGTYSMTNTIADLSTVPQEYVPYPGDGGGDNDHDEPKCMNCTVHTGFYTSWRHTRNEILPHVLLALKKYPGYNVTLVGHSLGGAVATFAGLEMLARGMNPTITTFGEPRIGNQALADYVDIRFGLSNNRTITALQGQQRFRRVTHVDDPVPLLPLEEWGYVPHGGEIFISKPDLPPNIEDVHYCDGSEDPDCLTGPELEGGLWRVPTRFKLWQLFFAHRDYFWRLGLCVPLDIGYWTGHGGKE
ncbi:ABC transporter G family member 19 [Venturia nashicola]|nr:ABC transporter G family member 19 [Venturia nashicola]